MSKAFGEPHSDASILSSCVVPLFQNESLCKNSSYKNELDLQENEPVDAGKTFSCEWSRAHEDLFSHKGKRRLENDQMQPKLTFFTCYSNGYAIFPSLDSYPGYAWHQLFTSCGSHYCSAGRLCL